MATFADLQTRVGRRIIDAPASVVAELPTLVNSTIREAQNMLNFPVMKARKDVITQVDVRDLGNLPSDFKAYRARPYRTSFLGTTERVRIFQGLLSAETTVGSAGVGGVYGISETNPDDLGTRSWQAWPLPDGLSDWNDGEYRVSIPYWKILPALVNGTDQNWFTVNCEEWIVAKATARGMELDWNDGGTITFETIATKEWQMIKSRMVLELSMGQDTLVPSQGANDDTDWV